MPIFEYECEFCGEPKEILTYAAPPRVYCPLCGTPMKIKYSTFNQKSDGTYSWKGEVKDDETGAS